VSAGRRGIPSAAKKPVAGMDLVLDSCTRYYIPMNNQERNRSADHLAAAERAHNRATGGGGLGDIALYILMRSCNVMMTERLGNLLAPHGLTSIGYITMMALYSRPENLANPSELSEVTGETRGNMTRICDELVDKGWMRRVPNGEDRRRIDLSLSESGMALLNRLVPELRQNADDFYKRSFTKAEKTTLLHLLTKFSEALASEL
jgi:MarR family transcriptional regulator, negative regulator of the multidrug operon emrRAB